MFSPELKVSNVIGPQCPPDIYCGRQKVGGGALKGARENREGGEMGGEWETELVVTDFFPPTIFSPPTQRLLVFTQKQEVLFCMLSVE